MEKNMKWISSYGGPFVCADIEVAKKWLGARGSSLVANNGIDSDYASACKVNGHAGLLAERISNVLVIGDLPDEITGVELGEGDGVFIKWIGAESDEQISNSMNDIRQLTYKGSK